MCTLCVSDPMLPLCGEISNTLKVSNIISSLISQKIFFQSVKHLIYSSGKDADANLSTQGEVGFQKQLSVGRLVFNVM